LRESYDLYYFLDNWILTGLGEELLFAGLIFNLLLRKGKIQKTWLVVMIISFLFAIWHLPKHLAIMLNSGNVSFGFLFRLLMNVLSWNIFGWLYVKSKKNLWLVAFAHASTDYPLLPMIVKIPVMGIVFMLSLFILLIAYRKLNYAWLNFV
ncbi:MAG: type II CAAX prenyl endopeptidase Rce1 family protein, partial [bacterium]